MMKNLLQKLIDKLNNLSESEENSTKICLGPKKDFWKSLLNEALVNELSTENSIPEEITDKISSYGKMEYIIEKLEESLEEKQSSTNNTVEELFVLMDESGSMSLFINQTPNNSYGMIYPVPDVNEMILLNNSTTPIEVFSNLNINKKYKDRFLKLLQRNEMKTDFLSNSNIFESMEIRKINFLERTLSRVLLLRLTSEEDMITFIENYFRALHFADLTLRKLSEDNESVVQNSISEIKISKIINLTDILMASLNASNIPDLLLPKLQQIYDYFLVQMKDSDLKDFYPNVQTKGEFILELFNFVQNQSNISNNIKDLMEIFKPFVKNDEPIE